MFPLAKGIRLVGVTLSNFGDSKIAPMANDLLETSYERSDDMAFSGCHDVIASSDKIV